MSTIIDSKRLPNQLSFDVVPEHPVYCSHIPTDLPVVNTGTMVSASSCS